jgi:RNA polymerase sigma factor (sigma-70 family)
VSHPEFEQIVDTYQKMVYNLALGYLQNKEDAEEITQDVFIKVFDNLHQFKGQSQLKTWIYRMTVNACLDQIKSKRFKLFKMFFLNTKSPDETTWDIAYHQQHPQEILEHKEGLNRLLKAIHQLPHPQKTVVLLLKVEHLNQRETAEVMEISIKAVESLFQRAKKNLEKILNLSKENEN